MRTAFPAALLAAVLVYGCVAPRDRATAPPPPASVPVPRPAQTPVVVPTSAVEPPVGWADLPDTPGTWTFSDAGSGPEASFAGQFTLRCDRAAGAVSLARMGASGPLTVTTTSAARQVGGSVPANDPLLDAIAFSRGHFTVDAAGQPRLVLPAQPEVARVVEDCRS